MVKEFLKELLIWIAIIAGLGVAYSDIRWDRISFSFQNRSFKID